jgi:hypothetical protein
MLVCSRCPTFSTFIQFHLARHLKIDHNLKSEEIELETSKLNKSQLGQSSLNRNQQESTKLDGSELVQPCSNKIQQKFTKHDKSGLDQYQQDLLEDEIAIISDNEQEENSKINTKKKEGPIKRSHQSEQATKKQKLPFTANYFVNSPDISITNVGNLEPRRFECDECWFTADTIAEYFQHLQIQHHYSKDELPLSTT